MLALFALVEGDAQAAVRMPGRTRYSRIWGFMYLCCYMLNEKPQLTNVNNISKVSPQTYAIKCLVSHHRDDNSFAYIDGRVWAQQRPQIIRRGEETSMRILMSSEESHYAKCNSWMKEPFVGFFTRYFRLSWDYLLVIMISNARKNKPMR